MNSRTHEMTPAIKVLAVLEATTVTGVAKNILDFCRWVRALGHERRGLPAVEMSLVTFHRLGASRPRTSREADLSNRGGAAPNEFVRVARGAGVEVDTVAERFRFDPRVITELCRVVERRAPDVIATHNLKSHFLVRASGLGRRHPWVAFHHGYTTTDLKMRLYNRLNRWSLPAAGRVVTVCQAFARELEHEGVPRGRISVRHNAIEAGPAPLPAEVEAARARFGIKEGERVVLAVGRFSREKAHVDLVDAFSRLCRARPGAGARLVVVGDGPEKRRIEETASAHGIAEQVILTGQLSDVRPLYAMADVLALPSHSEGSPYVLLEAMAAGLPVVATSVGGVPEMVADGESALLVPPRDPQAFAAALVRALGDAALARTLAANAAARAATHFSPEAYTRSITEIYRELLPGGACRASARPVAI